MRIYNRTDFMELPAGTIYAKGKQWHFDELNVKGDTIRLDDGTGCDWACRDLIFNIEHTNGGDCFLAAAEMLETGRGFPLDDAYGRDGCYDDEDVFLVYDPPDLLALAKLFLDAAETELT